MPTEVHYLYLAEHKFYFSFYLTVCSCFIFFYLPLIHSLISDQTIKIVNEHFGFS